MRGVLHGFDRRDFMLAGDATFTIQSPKTGARFTYRVMAPRENGKMKEDPIRFVKLLCGPDNSSNSRDYHYFGIIRLDEHGMIKSFEHAKRKTRIQVDAPGAVAFRWFVGQITNPGLDFYHEGKCGRCGRKLTVPESISRGLGAACAGTLQVFSRSA